MMAFEIAIPALWGHILNIGKISHLGLQMGNTLEMIAFNVIGTFVFGGSESG